MLKKLANLIILVVMGMAAVGNLPKSFCDEYSTIALHASDVGSAPKSSAENISASLDGNTVTVSFASDFGAVEISIETLSGELVTSTACLFTPDDAVLNVSGTGTFVLVIETSTGTFTGQFTIN